MTLHAGESILGRAACRTPFPPLARSRRTSPITFTPAGKMEQFFRDVAVPIGPTMDAALFARYDVRYA